MSKAAVWGATALAIVMGSNQALAQTPIPPSPRAFVMAASQSDQYEIMAAHTALAQSKDQRVKSFAEQMIREHTRLNADLREAVKAAGMQPPEPGLSQDQASMLASLQGLRGAEFDRAYARQQDLAHTQAVAVEDSFATGGADPKLKEATRKALPSIQDHLKMARQLRAEIGGS